jgi:hypothetical protein
MANTAQKRALKAYRKRLDEGGMARFEVLGLSTDREPIRSLARRLAEQDSAATRLRTAVYDAVSGERQEKGGILSALRRSPLVGADLHVSRSTTDDRKLDLVTRYLLDTNIICEAPDRRRRKR